MVTRNVVNDRPSDNLPIGACHHSIMAAGDASSGQEAELRAVARNRSAALWAESEGASGDQARLYHEISIH
jgi:hypothetical protein